jgi:hypothetical protein
VRSRCPGRRRCRGDAAELPSLVEKYLAYRRGLGLALETPAWLRRDFARQFDRCGHRGPLTIEFATGWALSSRSADSAQPARAARGRPSVRARYLALLEPAIEVPPPGLLGRVPHRRQAHIYSEGELAALLREASLLLPRWGAPEDLRRLLLAAGDDGPAAFRGLPARARRR